MHISKNFTAHWLPALLFPTLILAAWIIYSPGITGPFFFDDHVHLPRLKGSGNGIDTFDEVVRLVLPEHGGSGRSISYLSLLIDDNGWPSPPEHFKRTNILIHLLNGVLVFIFLRSLTRMVRLPGSFHPHEDWVALLGTALWLLHPIHLSPTMMVIQRMTLLGGFFSLLALIAYLLGRKIAAQQPILGAIWLIPVFGLTLVLGILSKETALMTVAYVAILEFTVLRYDHPLRPSWWPAWSAIFIWLPLALLIFYLAIIASTMAEAYATRSFNLEERLLTEGRVLMQYLRVILFPSLSQSTPFRDDFSISHGLFSPPETFGALLCISFLVGLSVIMRRRWKFFALAVLWFFVGHLLEGTVLPLELYFEHRNYLPMLGGAFAFSYGLMSFSASKSRLVMPGIVVLLLFESAITFASSQVWGNKQAIAILWSAERPGSQRAQLTAINYWVNSGEWQRFKDQLDQATATQPNIANWPIYRFAAERCSDTSLQSLGASVNAIEITLTDAQFDYGSLEGVRWILDQQGTEQCRITSEEMQRIFDALLASPKFIARAETKQQIYMLMARYKQQQGDLNGTICILDSAYMISPSFIIALDQAYFLATAGLIDDAEHYVNLAAKTPPKTLYDWLEKDRKISLYRMMIHELREQPADIIETIQKSTSEPH
jgi:hypothetical protein